MKRAGAAQLVHEPSSGHWSERTIYGGLKTKQIDVSIAIPGIGPVVLLSIKGAHNAFRNLTNRMEEAAGDCTNLHMAYPAAVVAYWMVLRANEQSDDSPRAHFRLDANGRYLPADIAVTQAGHYSPGVERLAYALERLSDREDVRDSHSRYEACGLTLASAREGGNARFTELPGPGTILDVDRMFRRIYEIYDRRFVYQAPALAKRTRRLEWHAESEILVSTVVGNMDFEELAPRLRA